ncbi:WXG100 family type VII secretion target [Actinopolymorpha alba]|uniref:WXG100 family type VII secretion target n=1 Tax=Actinopolymorpha alba TaxID=533267 RepID=UPI00036A18CA|nr:hypothetical protein [Actinopolymorpha alba]
MGEQVDVGWDKLRRAAGDVDDVAQRLGRELQSTQGELAGYGEPWGGDEIGMLIGITHQVVSEFAFEKLGELQEDLATHSQALEGVATTYRDNEEGGQQAMEQLGNGAEAI